MRQINITNKFMHDRYGFSQTPTSVLLLIHVGYYGENKGLFPTLLSDFLHELKHCDLCGLKIWVYSFKSALSIR